MENMANLSNDNVVKRNVNSLPPVPAFVTKESYQHAGSFLPQPTDIFVNCPPKCGTTWMSQIVHQLRSGGDMSFNDIDEVVLWIDTAYTFGDVIDKEQTYHPRIFKSHMSYKTSPKGGKYVIVYREPCAVIDSLYRFLEGHFYISGEMTIETFISDIYKKKIKELMDYFEHLRSWWPRRNDSNVLMLTYEDMSNDLESAVRSVATFVGITDEGSIRNAVKMSSFDFMKIHKDKFNMSIYLQNLQRIGYLGTSLLERVATGSATKGREMMSEQAKQAIQNMWNESITSTIGLKNYEEFCTALNNEKHQ